MSVRTDAASYVADLRANGVACRRGSRTIVSGVDVTIPAGTRMAVVGPNGAGKTTLLRVLAGLETPATGAVYVGGADLHAMRARQRARTVAVVAQEEQPSAELTVAEAVGLGRTPHRNPWAAGADAEREIVADALEMVGLGDAGGRSCIALSGGERHRVVLARALAQQTPMLVLDEPTNHLDAAWRLRLMRILDKLDRTIVAAMHDLDLVLRHFDSVAVIADGRLVTHGPPVEVLDNRVLRDVFAVDGDIITHPRTGRPHLLLTDATPSPPPGRTLT
ncbi:ABC transporter ATP-binding protein [Gordonia sp. SW 21]|uniref:ABC transporter ATP-binding protein n=1 Tax=Gordonia aquimaris TaxID=2984863 RepID=A0A9X3D8S5_9ACTN|nr:ABC transporter ATP-binding protein [Gordonia aquimaris]MCX2966797.1 ABC transporter ATP-binding protein [Gordonia aquimaris]